MPNITATIPFRRGAVEPIVCLKSGWVLIKDHYWLFVGMSAVGILIGSLVPFGILFGPMMCGIYLSLFQLRRGRLVEFGNLFKGFDYFGESIIVTLIHLIPLVMILIPFYVVLYGGMFFIMSRQGAEPDPASLFGFFAVVILFGFLMIVAMIVISVIFTFAYPLIVDRKLPGLEAVKLSAKAALANFWPLLGLLLLSGVITFAGVLLCYIGMFLAFPITFAAMAMAYEQVFGLSEAQSPLPPPPPVFS
jgi:uncharacterized membrane protein